MSSSRRLFLIILGVLVFVLVGGFIIWKIPREPDEVNLEFWGVFDDSDHYAPLIAKFNQSYPWIKIKYKKFPYEEYERSLLEAWATGGGPDMFLMHNTWLPKHQSHIYPYPQDKKSPLNTEAYKQTFMPVATSDFVSGGQIYAIPFYSDNLALYYNKGILEELFRNNPDDSWILEPPETWDEFINLVKYVTDKDEWGNIRRAGAAIGTTENINRASDILSLIMLQSGTQMVSSDLYSATFNKTTAVDGQAYNPGERSLRFYTDFANPRKNIYTWNTNRDYSIDDFAEGDVAMIFGYSYLIDTIKKKNPSLQFEVAPMPQIQEATTPINYANYWAPTVSRLSQKVEEAWTFIEFCSREENVFLYLNATNRPTVRRGLISWQEKEMPNLAVFAKQGLTAKTWYQIDSDAVERIFLDMINKVNLSPTSVSGAINEAAQELTVLMQPEPEEKEPPKSPFDF